MTNKEASKVLQGCFGHTKEVNEALNLAIKALEERQKGKWITKPHVHGVTYCSECDFELKIDDTNFCPNCGADMRGDV